MKNMNGRKTAILILGLMIAAQALAPQTHSVLSGAQFGPPNDPLGSFEGNGVPGSILSTGDGQRLVNPSFESGLSPWTQSQYNTANGSAVTLAGPGYSGTTSAQLLVNSGNSSALSLASDSTMSLTDYVGQQGLVFNSATRFQLAVQVQTLTGTTRGDFVEARLTMTTSNGNLRTLHYVFADGSTLPSNSTTDGYLKATGFGTMGQWVFADRNLPADAAATFSDAAAFNTVQSITLEVHGQSLPGAPMVDPKIKFWDSGNFSTWSSGGEFVIYDANNNGMYDSGETVIGCGYPNSCISFPPSGTVLKTDPRFKFLDSNNDGLWNCYQITGSICTNGETVAYDREPIALPTGDGVYEFGEPIVNCASTLPSCVPSTPPLPQTLLEKVIQGRTQAMFDRIELYTATGGYDSVRNGGFEAGVTGWYSNSSFGTSVAPVHSGLRSVAASITGTGAEMAQSIDARPQVGPNMNLQASVNVIGMTGTTASDSVDFWIAFDDNQGNTLSLYYYLRTGTGTIPTNRTDTVYLKANGFGTMSRWINTNVSLLQVVQAAVLANSLSYTGPYTVELIVLEVGSSPFKTTTANFDDISLGTAVAQTGSTSSYFYAVDGLNTTYVYSATSIPQGSFSLDIPQGRKVLNVTSPEGSTLATGEYTTSTSSGTMRVTVLDSASFKHAPVGDWMVFTSSKNGIGSVNF